MQKALALILFCIMAAGCANTATQSVQSQEYTPDNMQPKAGLGKFCSGENCIAFCQNNRGICTDECKGATDQFCQSFLTGGQIAAALCDSNTKPQFTRHITNLSMIESITPIGNIKAGSQSRSYLFPKAKGNGRMLVPIYAPMNATLFGIVYAQRGGSTGRAEYRLDLRASCEVVFAFDHISQISERLKELAPETPASTTARDKEINLPVTEGELLGHTDGVFGTGTFDFFLFNYKKEVSHANPARWTSDHNKNADCPYDYFPEDMKNEYYQKFASAGGEKTQTADCRSASRDVPGTLSGAWFQGNATDMQGTRLLLGSDYSTVDLVVDENNPLATGSTLSIRQQNAAKPEEVRVGQSACYSDGKNHAFLLLLSENQMASHIGTGPCPARLPEKHEVWER